MKCPYCLGTGTVGLLSYQFISGTKVESVSSTPCFMCSGMGETFEQPTSRERSRKSRQRQNRRERRGKLNQE
jgi:hypothetical protein